MDKDLTASISDVSLNYIKDIVKDLDDMSINS